MSILPRKCPQGHINRPQAKFCHECGLPLDQDAQPAVLYNTWVRDENDFAVRIEARDLKGLFKRGLIIEPGTNALLLDGGAVKGTLPPGTHNMDSLDKRLADWISTGIGSQVTAQLVSVRPTDLNFNAGGIFTRDPIKVGVSVRVQVMVDTPGRFVVNMLGGRERYSKLDLEGYFYPEVSVVIERWVRQYSLRQLAEESGLREKLELALVEALKPSFEQCGLRFNFVRTMQFDLDRLDLVNNIHDKYNIQLSEIEAENQGQSLLHEALREGKDLEWAKQDAEVADEERRAALYQRMREAVLRGKMQEARSEAEYEAFLNQMDLDKLLREKERAELLQSWREDAADRQGTRAHQLARLQLEREYELKSAEFRLRKDLNAQEVEDEMRLERVRVERTYQLEAEKLDFDIKQRRKQEDFEAEMAETRRQAALKQAQDQQNLQAQEHSQQIQQMLDLIRVAAVADSNRLDRMERQKQIEWEDERRRREHAWNIEKQKIETDLQRERDERTHKLEWLKALGELGTEALIIAGPAEQARLLADLKKHEALKGMSEDQILAAAAEKSPHVAQALAEKYRAVSEGRASQQEKELYERMLDQHRDELQRINDQWNRSAEREQGTARHAIDKMAEVAQSFARNAGGTPVIIAGSGQAAPAYYPGQAQQTGQAPGGKTCIKCGNSVLVDMKFCPHCGNKFEGM